MLLESSVTKALGRSPPLEEVILRIYPLLKHKRPENTDTNPWKKWNLRCHNLSSSTVLHCETYSNECVPCEPFSFSYLKLSGNIISISRKKKKVTVDINGTWHRLRFLQNLMNYLDNLMNQENPVCWVFQTRALTKKALICSCFLTTAMNH